MNKRWKEEMEKKGFSQFHNILISGKSPGSGSSSNGDTMNNNKQNGNKRKKLGPPLRMKLEDLERGKFYFSSRAIVTFAPFDFLTSVLAHHLGRSVSGSSICRLSIHSDIL